MSLWNKNFPQFDVPGETSGGGGAPAAEVSQAPPTNPTDSNPDSLSQEDGWVLDLVDNLRADDAQEEVDLIEPVSPVPIVSSQEGKPEGEVPPSKPSSQSPVDAAAIATPAVQMPAAPAAVPSVGAPAAQPAALVAQSPKALADDPTQIMSRIAEGIQQQKDVFIEQLSQRYLMSEKEADDLGFTPEQAKFLARAQARAQVEATASISQAQAQQLPVFLNGILEARQTNQRREEEFFGQWPQLKTADRDTLAKVFQAVNTLNPDLKGAAWSRRAGEMACLQLGLPAQASGVATQNQQVRTPGPIVRTNGALPHLPVGTSTAPAPVAQKSEMERFFELLQRTDAGEFEQ